MTPLSILKTLASLALIPLAYFGGYEIARSPSTILGASYLFPSGGGTGTSTNPTYGQMLVGNSGGTYTLTATSSLGITAAAAADSFNFTPTTNFGNTAVSTSTQVWFRGSPFSISASNTSVFATATATALTVTGNTYLSGITSALTLTGADGLIAEYAGTTCTNQAVTVLSALGAATCSSINNDYWSGTDLSVANGGTGLSTFGGSNTVLYTTAADALASEAAFTYNQTTDLLTVLYATTTNLSSSQGAWFATGGGNVGIASSTPLGRFGIEQGTESYSFWVGNTGSSTPSLMVRGINGNGMVGIGTTTPAATLDVRGSIVSEEASTTAGTTDIDWRISNQHNHILNANTTFTFTNGQRGGGYRLILCQDATGSRTVTWPSGVIFSGGTAPTLTTTGGKCDLITFTASSASTTNSTNLLRYLGGSVLNF